MYICPPLTTVFTRVEREKKTMTITTSDNDDKKTTRENRQYRKIGSIEKRRFTESWNDQSLLFFKLTTKNVEKTTFKTGFP